MTPEEVILAERIARKAHRNQTRNLGTDAGKPYIIHPERMVKALSKDSDLNSRFACTVLAVAWLHDVLEDTEWDADMLEWAGISERVIEAVKILSHRKEDMSYSDYILSIIEQRNLEVSVVKQADILDNLKNLYSGSLKDKLELSLIVLYSLRPDEAKLIRESKNKVDDKL